jgi:hypothetical protein
VRLQGGRFVDPLTLSNHIFNIRVGARLRGLEADVEGQVAREGTNVLLAVGGTNAVLQLAPLTSKVQQNVAAKQPQDATSKETRAFQDLAGKLKTKPRPVRITGPLRHLPDGSVRLEVRSFKLN